jgi:lactoylglutathione lyase
MAKAIHQMIRVFDEDKAVDFYKRAFGLDVAGRFDFDDFTLVYMKNPETDFELELTVNKGREAPYKHGEAYGHLAFAVDDLDAEYARLEGENLGPTKKFEMVFPNGTPERAFFLTDPDGYKIEIVQRGGRFQ